MGVDGVVDGGGVRRAVAVLVLLLYGAGAILGFALQSALTGSDGNVFESVLLFLGFGGFTVLGAILIDRRPGVVLGPLFASTGVAVGLGFLGESYVAWLVANGHEPTWLARLLAWPNAWYWYAMLALIFVYVPLLFPDGRLPSPRWRWVVWPISACIAAAVLVAAVAERVSLQSQDVDGNWLTVANPLGIPGVADAESNALFGVLAAAMLPGMVVGIAAIVVRFRRSRGPERQQIKWFLFAVALLPLAMLSEVVPGDAGDLVGGLAFSLALVFLPLSIGIAMLRYRLFEIDRIISRTVTYALVIAVLVAVYTGVVVGVTGLVPAAGESDLTVAGSTLVVAALFGPLLRRVRAAVNRRFNRTRFDAALAAEAFGRRTRDRVDLEVVTTDLRRTIQATLAPSSVALWLRDEPVADAVATTAEAACAAAASWPNSRLPRPSPSGFQLSQGCDG